MTTRWMLLAALALPGMALAQAGAPGDAFGPYPPAPKVEPFVETVHGVAVSDPYRWMEKPERRPEMVAWVNASSRQFTTAMAALPGYPALLKALGDASRAATSHGEVKVAGDRMFFTELAPDRNVPVLMVREGGRDRLFLDPAAGAKAGTPRTINNFMPSPDGRLVAIHIAEGGGEVGSIRFYDAATARPLPDELAPVWGEFAVQWIDPRTVAYTRMRAAGEGDDAMAEMQAFVHVLGQPAGADRPVLGTRYPSAFRMAPVEFPFVGTRDSSPWAIAQAGNARADGRGAVARKADLLAGRPQWQPLFDYADKINDADLYGDDWYVLTTKDDPNGEIRRVDLRRPSLASSVRVLGSGGRVLKGVAATASGLYVLTMAPDATSHLLFLPRGRAKPVEVALPYAGSIEDIHTTPDQTAVTFAFNGITRNATYYRAQGGRLSPLGIEDATLPAARTMQVVQETATSADGTAVPLTIIAPSGPKRVYPTILGTYASYGASGTPYYSPAQTVWVTRGGVVAECHARGGGEKGRAWHEGGRSANKVNAMADVVACGERLVALGWTTPAKMGLWSASAGGLLVTPVGLKRPDLFRAVVTGVGVVNPTRLGAANNGANQFAEMGDPNTAEGFRALAAQDSTLLLASAQGGTDQLFTIGLNDRRVEPWMSAKLVAAMRAKWGNRHLVAIRSDAEAGHGIGSTRDQRLAERADVYAFFLNRFGEPGFVR
jgi:prolyl oligopeptidase